MSRTGTGRRLGSSRSRVDRNPRGSATRGLHDSLPHVGAVEVKTLGLGLGTNVQDTLIVTRQDEGELTLDVVPVREQPSGNGGLGPPTMSGQKLQHDLLITLTQRQEVGHLTVDPTRTQIQDIGHTTGHTRCEVATSGPKDEHGATGHVLATVVAHSFDHCRGTRVAHTEPLADLAAQEDLTAGGSVGDDIAGDDVVLCRQGSRAIGPNHDPATRKSLTHIVAVSYT